ncbi:MAG: trypsin-like peptidase domain-containing protein [Candidatus Promineifilaceae bacterium]
MKTRTFKYFIVLLLVIFGLTACNGLTQTISSALPISAANTSPETPDLLVRVQDQQPDANTNTAVETQAETSSNQLLAADTSLQDSLIDLYQVTNPSVVYIIVPPYTSGSGFVYSNDGYIVTNNHVIAQGNEFEVVFSNGDRMSAELVGANVDSDLAVLKVDHLPDGVEPLQLGDSESIRVGEFVVAIGNPFGEQGSMSLGIVSALGRSLESQRDLGTGSSYSLPEVIQTDAPINPGNSGGPLLSLDGKVLGVNSAIASTTGTNSGVGFSIPVQALRQVIPSLIENGRYDFPYMGAGFDDEISLSEQAIYGVPQTQGAYVLNVTLGSPAAQAGLVAASNATGEGGDLIVDIDGHQINNFSDLNSYLVFHTTVGQTIQITVLRDGQRITLPLTLGARP